MINIRKASALLVACCLFGVGAAAAQDTADCDAGFRAIQDAAGTVCVPENPERIVALMETDLDSLLALGITPLGTTNGRGQPTPPRYLADYMDGIEIVGNFYAPNVEMVLELQPDLILMGGFDDEAVLAQLREIAPVVNTFIGGEPWQTSFLRVADAVNKTEEAQAFLQAYAERVSELQATLGENAGAVVNIVRWNPQGPGIMYVGSFASRVLGDLGLQRPESAQGEGPGHTPPLSLEDLGQIDADWVFLGTLAAEGEAADLMADVVETPLFQQLGAVQNGQLVFMDGSLWTSIGGPLAALAVLDDVEAAMADPALLAAAEATPEATAEAGS